MNTGVQYKPPTTKERIKKHFTETVVPVLIAILFVFVFFGIILMWPFMESISIKKDIAQLNQVSYSNIWELNKRVKFYQFDAVKAGDFNGIYCEIDGSHCKFNDDISRKIRNFVTSWCN